MELCHMCVTHGPNDRAAKNYCLTIIYWFFGLFYIG